MSLTWLGLRVMAFPLILLAGLGVPVCHPLTLSIRVDYTGSVAFSGVGGTEAINSLREFTVTATSAKSSSRTADSLSPPRSAGTQPARQVCELDPWKKSRQHSDYGETGTAGTL
ncbi:MAG: hypothetical protein KME19_21880 [Microcoleus vaginatus WJT46-NPBG5]|nr:hypothetical protein [Microcoleus vaginatus WJT46-NPBG5]